MSIHLKQRKCHDTIGLFVHQLAITSKSLQGYCFHRPSNRDQSISSICRSSSSSKIYVQTIDTIHLTPFMISKYL